MASGVIGTRGEELSWRKPINLAQDLGFASIDEMRAFIKGDRFWPFFEVYAKEYIWPDVREARKVSGVRGRGPNLATVEERLIHGERPGSDKFSRDIPKTSMWDKVDHQAYLLYRIRRNNINSSDGIFFGKALSDSEISTRIWALIKYCEYNEGATRAGIGSTTATAPSPSANDSPSLPSPQFQPEQPPQQYAAASSSQQMSGPGSNVHATAEVSHSMHVQQEFIDRADKPIQPAADHSETDAFGVGVSLSNARRMEIENDSLTPDMKYRWWQCWVIAKATTHTGDFNALSKAVDYARKLDRLRDIESNRYIEIQTEDMETDFILSEDTAKAAEDFDKAEEYLSSERYQRQDLKRACGIVGVEYQDNKNAVFRIPGMALSHKLMHWQVLAIAALITFHLIEKSIRGCVLGDVVGLGKTWEIIGTLLQLDNMRKHLQKSGRTTTKAKPTLVLVPQNILLQWISQIFLVAPDVFTVYRYHGDTRGNRFKPVADERSIEGNLTNLHPVFNGSEETATAIVVSTYTTWNMRNGPTGQKKWRTQYGWSEEKANRERTDMDIKFPGLLRDLFGVVVCDEAHILKTEAAQASVGVTWLNADFHILASATPIPNGIADWEGYMPFIQHKDADKWWSDASLAKWNVNENVNPFVLPKTHPAHVLRYTARASKDFISRPGVSPVDKGLRLAQIWEKTLLRRTNASRIPFGNGPKIGESLPAVRSYIIHCPFTEEEQEAYDGAYGSLTSRLLEPLSTGKGTGKWSLAIHRKLQLLSMSLHLPKLDYRYNMKATNVRRLCEDSTFVRSCLRDIAPDVDPKKMDDIVFKVHQLCHGAPKLRVLLKNLRDQVIRDKEKALIVCQLPAVSVYLLEVLKILDIKAEAYAAFQSMEEKQSIIDRFNTPGSVLRVLIIPYALAGFGLNLQKDCWRIHAIECAWNLAALEQAIGRIRRLGNPQPIVYVYEYIVPGTFDDKAIQRNIEKAIPQAMAELNRQIFFGKDTDDGTGSVDVGDWVSHEGQLWRYEEAREKFGRHFPVLSAVDLLREILLGAKGQRIQA